MVVSVISSVLVIALWVLLIRYFPSEKSDKQTERSMRELRREYWKVDVFMLTLFFVLTAVLTYLSYHGFVWLSEIRFASFRPRHRLLLPNPIMWLLPSIFLAMLLSIKIITSFQTWLLREKNNEYIAYNNMKYKMDGERVARLVYPGMLTLIVIFVFLGLNHFAFFDHDKITSSRFIQFGISHHSYSEIQHIQKVQKFVAPNGKVVDNQHYVINFNDECRLGLRSLCENTPDRIDKAIEFALIQTGIQLKQVELEE